jgi:hypothetical protein
VRLLALLLTVAAFATNLAHELSMR